MSDTNLGDVSYELTFVNYDSGALSVEAELTSPVLDSILAPGGVVRVKIHTDPVVVKPKIRFPLNSFHVNSLIEFLQMQSTVRSTLEAELPRDRANWQKKKATREEDQEILKRVKLAHLALRPRKLLSPVYLARVKEVSPQKYDEIVAAEDSPQTQTYFRVVLDCPWDREHNVELRFRDGAFLNLAHE